MTFQTPDRWPDSSRPDCQRTDPEGGMTRRAFTLVEVLVTIAIIGLLVAILIPALSYATERAEDAACRSNLHQIAHCFHQYAASNRGYAPDHPKLAWQEQLHPYAPDTRVFRCPADTDPSMAKVGMSYTWRNSGEGGEANRPLCGIRRLNG